MGRVVKWYNAPFARVRLRVRFSARPLKNDKKLRSYFMIFGIVFVALSIYDFYKKGIQFSSLATYTIGMISLLIQQILRVMEIKKMRKR